MASRVAGAVFAVIAAALLAGAVLLVPWWSGHPTFKGVAIKAKEITVGPLGGTGCNVGGDGACMNVPVDPTFEIAGLALAGVTALLVLVAAAMATLALIGRDGRRTFAVFAIIGAAIAGALGGALVAIGPQIQTEAPLPITYGLYLFFGGIATAFVGALLAMRKGAPARMQLAPARQSAKQLPQSPAPPPPGVDVRALLAEDTLRPSSLGPEPMLGKQPPVQSPGGALPGPSGPLGAIGTSGPQPLFSSAPQLRPLYELQGGGIAKPAANFPLRAPTPIPRDQISAIAGIPTPASVDIPRSTAAGMPAVTPPPQQATPPPLPPPTPIPRATPKPPTPPPPLDERGPETDRDLLGTARAAKPRTLPPPNRHKPPSIAPMPPFVAMPKPITPQRPDTDDTDDDPGDEDSFDALQTRDANPRHPAPERPKPPTAAPRNSPLPASALPKSPIVAPSSKSPAAPGAPMSPTASPAKSPAGSPPAKSPGISAPATSAPPPASASPMSPAMSPSKSPATSAKPGTSTPAKSPAPLKPPPARLLTEDAPIDTDVSTPAIDENLPSTEAFERPKTVTSTMQTQAAPPSDGEDDELMTTARDKVSSTDVEGVPTVRPPAAADEAPTEREKPKPPLSTAPQSLPPPTEKQQVTSGPSPACPQCEAPMAWVEAHLRFYCKSCKMYF